MRSGLLLKCLEDAAITVLSLKIVLFFESKLQGVLDV